jgi:hypothetical protein
MNEFAPQYEARLPNRLRRFAGFIFSIDKEARRAEELKIRARNQQENEVSTSMVSQALAWKSDREVVSPQPAEE